MLHFPREKSSVAKSEHIRFEDLESEKNTLEANLETDIDVGGRGIGMRIKESIPQNIAIECVCATIAAATRIMYCLMYSIPIRDSYTYKKFIEQWISNGAIPENGGYPPLGLFLLKIPAELFQCEIIRGGIIVNITIGLFIVIELIRLSREIVNSSFVALCVGLISATHPLLIDFSCHMSRENSYMLFCCLSIIFFIRFLKRGSYALASGSSFCSALAFLCRDEALELAVIIVSIICFCKNMSRTRRVKTISVFAAGYLLSILMTLYAIGVPCSYFYSYYHRIAILYPNIKAFDSIEF